MRSFASLSFAVSTALFLVASSATAKPVVLGPPSSGAGGPCNVVDVMFRGTASDQCFGAVTDPNNDKVGGATPAGWTVNTMPVLGGNWEALARDEGEAAGAEYMGITWTLDATNDVGAGAWTLTLLDADVANLPLRTDLMVVLKGGTAWSAYLFSGESFFPMHLSDSGSFGISFKNNGGNTPGLSHMSLYFRDGTSFTCEPGDVRCFPPVVCERDCDAGDVPEPTSLLLLGVGLFGASVITRRKR